MEAEKDQAEKFRQAARELECDEDEARWDDRLKKIASQKIATKLDDADE